VAGFSEAYALGIIHAQKFKLPVHSYCPICDIVAKKSYMLEKKFPIHSKKLDMLSHIHDISSHIDTSPSPFASQLTSPSITTVPLPQLLEE
jgi:hypothetical protein